MERLISLAGKLQLIGVALLLLIGAGPAFAQGCRGATPGGAASCYVTGTFDLRDGLGSSVHIINPTGHHLVVYAFFFDSNEHPLRCIYTGMSPNDLWEIIVTQLEMRLEAKSEFGVVKIISFDKQRRPLIGIVGNQRSLFKGQGFSETSLHPIQSSLLEEDFNKMLKPLLQRCKEVKQ